MSYELPNALSVLGNTIHVSHPAIPANLVTYLTLNTTAGGTSLAVLDNVPFVQNDYLIMGKLGLDKTEIVQVSGAVTAGTALTVTATVYDHSLDVPVTKILWNQVEVSGAATISGSKTVIATIALQPDRSDTVYVVTGTTYAFYFVRFKNTQTSTFGAYSSAAPAGGYATNVIRSVKDTALGMINEKIDGVLFTDAFLNNEIFNCEQEVWSEKRRWSWAYTFDKILGQTTEGGLSFALPSDIADPNSNNSVLTTRLGTRAKLVYIRKMEWDRFFVDVSHSTVASTVTIGDTVINVTNVDDFASTGGGVAIGSDNAINYTGIDTTLNRLTGVTGIAANHSAGQDIWQLATFNEPAYYTIFSGVLYFQTGCISTYAGLNLYLSYYRKPTAIATDADTLNIPDFTIYHYYLAYKAALRKNNGATTPEIQAFKDEYKARVDALKLVDRTGQGTFMTPRTSRFDTSNEYDFRTSFIPVDQ